MAIIANKTPSWSRPVSIPFILVSKFERINPTAKRLTKHNIAG